MENRVNYLKRKWNYRVHRYIKEGLIGIFALMFSLGDFLLLGSVFQAGNEHTQ